MRAHDLSEQLSVGLPLFSSGHSCVLSIDNLHCHLSMAKISRFRSSSLLSRREIAIELPEFLLRALECRIAEANAGASAEEQITLEHLVEIELAACLSLAEVAHLERTLPGMSAAVSSWLNDIG
jgi:hypothetical protein